MVFFFFFFASKILFCRWFITRQILKGSPVAVWELLVSKTEEKAGSLTSSKCSFKTLNLIRPWIPKQFESSSLFTTSTNPNGSWDTSNSVARRTQGTRTQSKYLGKCVIFTEAQGSWSWQGPLWSPSCPTPLLWAGCSGPALVFWSIPKDRDSTAPWTTCSSTMLTGRSFSSSQRAFLCVLIHWHWLSPACCHQGMWHHSRQQWHTRLLTHLPAWLSGAQLPDQRKCLLQGPGELHEQGNDRPGRISLINVYQALCPASSLHIIVWNGITQPPSGAGRKEKGPKARDLYQPKSVYWYMAVRVDPYQWLELEAL